ncbi:beta 1-4 rhamnosyltransferase Cps2T [Liquorilactobacillus vini]|uniref:Rhamnosyltransferase n=1 Tax=Liquorilactobacillus vini DSM 20605 TaxID=1133569 RepID=A0A0R2C2E9_9LACO|nr:glycosyltransferase family 1 protein [Liquorilactobacillus vini]KRM85205.1 rhamnosyltransferase [Liquorilactobacillus vini DSM 20605]
MKHVFIVGSKGIPAKYGGFETFVDNLVSRQVNKNIKYHVACMTFDKKTKNYEYHGAECHEIAIPNIGGAKAIVYDLKALNWALETIKSRSYQNGIIYILACRIGPFIHSYVSKFHRFGFKVWVNPDGHEWKRAKWSKPVREYWKISERLMVKNADLLICDSKTIEKYIHTEYKKYNPQTTFIAYGADVTKSSLSEKDRVVEEWFSKFGIKFDQYFLIVGRFVPENNFETMIREFMSSNVENDLVIITNVERNKFYNELKEKTHFDKDSRIKFVGTVYDQQLLKFIREHALAYIHGHSVGGTNPSLLEALASTRVNLLYDVGFNKEVALNAALYWNKKDNSLEQLLETVVNFSQESFELYSSKANQRISENYSWGLISNSYEDKFLRG